MINTDIAEAIAYLLPDPQFVLVGHDIKGITWLDERPMPSNAEIEKAIKDVIKIKKTEADQKAVAKAVLLEKLGITADEAKLLLG